MKNFLLIATTVLLLSAGPAAYAKQAQAAPKAQPPTTAQAAPATPMPKKTVADNASKPVTTAAKQDPSQTRGSAAKTNDVATSLDKFGQDLIVKMNKHGLNCETRKIITKNADGSYSAAYKVFDKNSLRTSYTKPDNARTIAYIGYLSYDEVSYICTGSSEKAVHSAPCKEVGREPIQELVKHKNGRWTY